MKNEDIIKKYFKDNGVLPFWVDSAMGWIRRAIAGNNYFVKEISKPKISVINGYVSRFECNAVVIVPDNKKTIRSIVSYSFDPSKTPAHDVRLSRI